MSARTKHGWFTIHKYKKSWDLLKNSESLVETEIWLQMLKKKTCNFSMTGELRYLLEVFVNNNEGIDQTVLFL